MKILFFLALLVNIIVFLWEYNSGALNTADIEIDSNKDKQILLVSELSTGEKDKLLTLANNKADVSDFVGFPKGDTISESENKEIDKLVQNAPNLAVTKNKDNNIVLKENQEPYEEKRNHKVEQGLLNTKAVKAVKAVGEKASDIASNTTVAENFVAKEKLNSTDIKLNESKDIELNHLVKDTLIPPVENISLAMVNKNQSKEKIDNDKIKIKGKGLKKESPTKTEEKRSVSIDQLVDKKKTLDNSKVGTKSTNKEVLKSKKIDATIQAKKASKPTVSNPPKKTSETKLAKQPEMKGSPKVPGLDKVKASAEQKKSKLKDDTASTVKTINNSKVSEEKVLKNKIKQSSLFNTQCYDIGPFQNKFEFEVWRKQNKIKLSSTRLLKKSTSKASSFLVYYPPAKNFEESKKNVNILKRMGITDYWLFLKGDLKGAISLGLFSKESRALRFKEKLGNLGLDVKIKQRYKTEKVLYTKIVTKDNKFKEMVAISKMQTISKCKVQQVGIP